jgi:hypothetical protein
MSRDSVNGESTTNRDITWQSLIEHSESEIRTCAERLKMLRKSLYFFRKKAASGEPFPLPSKGRHDTKSLGSRRG